MRTALALLMLLAAAPVLAQDSASSGTATSSSNTSASTGKKPRKVIRLEALQVEGRIQKPQAFYILPRSNLSFDELNRTESFVPKVVKSVEQDPF
ncbi:hypothetical protein HPC49_53165 [Pyxidicoccus fallax]|uniref:Uncharacterized protein n=1 Tax=Pyxidicoccus fallax TaxID=394095 RepID=A0A848M247_9BACT|nr:hypothetical protein [Pyxidicoccus fallax]NMO23553.1 hypothetical protein [Pyxidicoccus fallax]NPC86922.1 hypothetical protein [Pyxidicoccus fallax]